MKMFDNLSEIDLIIRNDVDLWKLLYYKSNHWQDDPLTKDSILDYPIEKQFPIINLRLKYTPVTSDLANTEICRIIFYPAQRRPQQNNYMVADQEINFDIFCHANFNNVDMRLSKISDRVNELFSNRRITGMGKATFVSGKPFTLSDKGYVGYTLVYRFGSGT